MIESSMGYLEDTSFVRINVCMVPSFSDLPTLLDLANKFSSHLDTKFVVDNLDCLLHITIYSPLVPRRSLPRIVEALKEFNLLRSIKLDHEKVSSLRIDNNFIQVIFQDPNGSLFKIHQEVLKIINPFRGDLLNKIHRKYLESNTATEEAKDNIRKYGIPNTDKLFRSHLSLGLLNDVNSRSYEMVNELKNQIPDISLIGVCLYEMDNLSACRSIIA